jgi:hypothetical protein
MKVPKKVLAGHRMIWGGKIPPGALAQLTKEYARMPGKKKRKKNPARKRRVTSAPIMKVLRESGAKRVRVMRSKSGKPTGLKFL